jgi:hypothetical protein
VLIKCRLELSAIDMEGTVQQKPFLVHSTKKGLYVTVVLLSHTPWGPAFASKEKNVTRHSDPSVGFRTTIQESANNSSAFSEPERGVNALWAGGSVTC